VSATSSFATLSDVIEVARSKLSPAVWDWIEGGTSGEQSLVANRSVFDQWFFAPDVLSGAAPVDLTTDILGIRASMPVFVSPFGSDGAIHPDRYLGVARALAATANTSIVSETSTDSLEAIAEACAGWQGLVQVTLLGPDEHVLHFHDRAAAAGFRGLCFTSSPVPMWRERSRRWEAELELGRFSGVGNQAAGAANPGELQRDPSQPRWTWDRVAALSDQLTLPWIFKGVKSAHDAQQAIVAGASGVYVSNFGGRKLDGMLPTLEVLADVVEAVEGRVPVYIDSGFRRGTDIAKALALGATAVGVGRLAAWGLAAGGEQGVRVVLELLRAELTSVIGTLGVSTPAALEPRHVRRLGSPLR
jgi:isopentenyl diphosphate isomerase/L-lactate dehydrogenase-like FMN-dependent dehydrogenase